MAKKYVVYIDGKDLATFPVVQTESGVYYGKTASGPYYKPLLKDFDDATLPTGYKKYTRGSHYEHRNNPKRNPIDFSIISGKVITTNFDIKVISYATSRGPWIKCNIIGTPYMVAFVHIYRQPKIGATIKAGSPICTIAPKSVTGLATHLHIDEWTGFSIRKLILDGDFMLNTGKNVEMLETMNVRNSSFKIIGTARKSSVCSVRSYYKKNNGFDYYKVAFGDRECYLADTNFNKVTTKPVTNLDGSKPDTCEDKVIELGKEIEALESIVGTQKIKIAQWESQVLGMDAENEKLRKYEEYYLDLGKVLEVKKV